MTSIQHWERRPSLWIEPIGDWGQGSVELVEIPSDNENAQNMIAFWRPKTPLAKGQQADFAYRQFWCWSPPTSPPLAVVAASRGGRGASAKQRRFLVDFHGDALADPAGSATSRPILPSRPARSRPRISISRRNRRAAASCSISIPASDNACELRLTLEIAGRANLGDLAIPMDAVNEAAAPRHRAGTGLSPRHSRRPCRRNRICPCRNRACRASTRKPSAGKSSTTFAAPWLSRFFVFGGGFALTCWGAYEMYRVIDVGGITTLKWMLLVLFLANFSWIALAFSGGVVGFVHLLSQAAEAAGPAGQALDPHRRGHADLQRGAVARLRRPARDLRGCRSRPASARPSTGFSFPTPPIPTSGSPRSAPSRDARAALGPQARVYYRHRAKNTARKAGNIADFVTRWGGAYEHMLVLDADSLMTGHAIVSLAAAMEADPDAGIIQTLPLIINRNTLFARVQQFAARIYGPVIADGLSCWMGRDGNYWGHNAIIRIKAFADHCGLPHLRGKPPFGGHIMSHDFVEAALIRRAGYAVYMLPSLGGSFEESPPSLIDVAARDRRWARAISSIFASCRRKGLHLRLPPAFRHRHHGLSRFAVLAGAIAGRHPARPAGELHPAGIFHQGFHAFPDMAAIRRGAIAGLV